jgi:hypothetical protein
MPIDVDKVLKMPENVWGYFEWFTGVIRLNIDSARFEQGQYIKVEKAEIDETYYHEFFHCCQICTTGYLYYYVAQFLKAITPVWRIITDKAVFEKKTMPLMLEAVFEECPAISPELMKLLSDLDEPGGPHGITSRTIIESQAFLVQKQISHKGIRHIDYIAMLDDSVSSEYSHGYLVAAEYLGASTMEHYHLIVYMSLLFLKPRDVFHEICALIARNPPQGTAVEAYAHSILDLLKNRHFYLGNSDDVTDKYILNKESNPFYKTSIALLKKTASKQKGNYLTLMAKPLAWFEGTIKKFDVPIILNPGEVYQHRKKHRWKVFGVTYSPTLQLILATICLIISNQQAGSMPRYLRFDRQAG